MDYPQQAAQNYIGKAETPIRTSEIPELTARLQAITGRLQDLAGHLCQRLEVVARPICPPPVSTSNLKGVESGPTTPYGNDLTTLRSRLESLEYQLADMLARLEV
jgi:hypothetical protein